MSETITGPRGEDMSIRAEVGMLSRNVRITGSTDVDATQECARATSLRTRMWGKPCVRHDPRSKRL